jgi:hypothetical protein
MGWDKGRYYTRSKKVNGRVVREYVGTGRVAELAAQLDTLEREKRKVDAQELRDEKDELAALDADIKNLSESIDLVARAALLATGYRQHKRGDWRRKRGNCERAEQAHTDQPGGDQPADPACPEG